MATTTLSTPPRAIILEAPGFRPRPELEASGYPCRDSSCTVRAFMHLPRHRWVRVLAAGIVVSAVVQVSCHELSLSDGFPCSARGNCPSPYTCDRRAGSQ